MGSASRPAWGWPRSGSCPARSVSSIISLGIVLTGTSIGITAIEVALGVILVGATITVIQRILHVRSQAKSAATNSTK